MFDIEVRLHFFNVFNVDIDSSSKLLAGYQVYDSRSALFHTGGHQALSHSIICHSVMLVVPPVVHHPLLDDNPGIKKTQTNFKIDSYTPRPVRPIRNDVTKSTRSALNVYKGTPRTNATRNAQRYAVQHKATRAKRNPKQCNSCCGLLLANK